MTRLLVFALLAGCERENPDTDTGKTETPTPTQTQPGAFTATATPGAVPNVLRVQWDPGEAGTSWVEYGLDGALDLRTPEGASPDQLVLGLKSQREYSWRAATRLADGTVLTSEIGTYTVPPPPQGVPPFTFTTEGDSVLDGRYILVQLGGLDQSWAVILDSDGDYVWAVAFEPGMQVSHFTVAHDHQSFWIAEMDNDQVEDLSRVSRYSVDGEALSLTRLPDQHHVVIEREAGDLMWLAHVTTLIEQDNGDLWKVVTDEVRTAPEGDGEGYAVGFNFIEDGVDWYVPCSHVSASEDLLGEPGYHEWTHTNSLVEAPDEGAYYITPRLHDAMLKIDAATELPLWQLGGRDNEFEVLNATPDMNPEELWSHGHMNDVWDDGLLMFDNNLHPGGGSRAQEWAIDQDRKTVELVWSYDEPNGQTVPLLGDVRRMPEGHRMVTWTTFGLMTEHDSDGEVVWRAELPVGTVVGRPTILDSLYGLVEAPKE